MTLGTTLTTTGTIVDQEKVLIPERSVLRIRGAICKRDANRIATRQLKPMWSYSVYPARCESFSVRLKVLSGRDYSESLLEPLPRFNAYI
jgi:hypothetical protein